MCRNSVVNVVETEKESISTVRHVYDTVTTCLRPYGNQALENVKRNYPWQRPILERHAIGKNTIDVEGAFRANRPQKIKIYGVV